MELYDLVQRTMARWGYPEDKIHIEEATDPICENNEYPKECFHPYCPEHSILDLDDPTSWPVEEGS